MRLLLAPLVGLLLTAAACGTSQSAGPDSVAAARPVAGTDSVSTATPFRDAAGRTLERATFATGCFWCTEADFDKVAGVVSTTSGYTGGPELRPTYDDVSGHRTGHIEAVQVVYDPAQVTYEALLERFWRTTDPTDAGGQFCDRGSPYRSAIFVHTPAQRAAAEASKAAVERTKPFADAIVTAIRPAEAFWAAEGYHQNYHEVENARYASYRSGCGRDARLARLWGTAPY